MGIDKTTINPTRTTTLATDKNKNNKILTPGSEVREYKMID